MLPALLVLNQRLRLLGGLIREDVLDGEQKVPGLGDLPLIGGLFKYNTRSRTKTNLLVFLRPVLLHSPESADSVTGDRYDYMLRQQIGSKPAPHGVLPQFEPPTLPPRQGANPAQPGQSGAQPAQSSAGTGQSARKTDASPLPAQDP